MPTESELELLRAERDLYRALLDLGTHEDPGAFLDEALALAVGVVGAHKGYLALDAGGAASRGRGDGRAPLWVAHACSATDVDAIVAQLSTGIVRAALEGGRTISTASAVEDPRFQMHASVQAQKLQAVLCAPIGGDRALGVLYLQGRDGPGPFTERDRALAETFARSIAPLTAQLLARAAPAQGKDHTAELRRALGVEGLVGRSRALAEAFRQILVAAPVDVPVLLLGESGTGKTEIARALHASSRRRSHPFVEVNCAALPETLFEGELFGAEKGAHSTATRRIPGKVAAAEGGTLFLDEIGEIPLAAQPKLLQFLQSRTYYRLGGDAPVRADVRIVAATNADLEQLIRERRFREDLYYRLNVLTVRAPALRERPEDIPLLAEHVARAASAAFGRPMGLTFAARAALAGAEWPGNVRQLAAAVQRGAAVALSEQADAIDVRHVFPSAAGDAGGEAAAGALSYQDATRQFQRRLLRETLEGCGGNVSEAARRLGLARSHLHELLRAHGLGRGAAPRDA